MLMADAAAMYCPCHLAEMSQVFGLFCLWSASPLCLHAQHDCVNATV